MGGRRCCSIICSLKLCKGPSVERPSDNDGNEWNEAIVACNCGLEWTLETTFGVHDKTFLVFCCSFEAPSSQSSPREFSTLCLCVHVQVHVSICMYLCAHLHVGLCVGYICSCCCVFEMCPHAPVDVRVCLCVSVRV